MEKLSFRTLLANEIDVRVARYTSNGKAMLLLYKDARVDQNLLDEVVGPMNWQRSHSRENANCTVSIWDDQKNCWVSKEDTGTESNTEKVKGLASDSFKRACFNWGIGRELYTAPTIFVPGTKNDFVNYKVSEIGYDDKRVINRLVITDDRGTILYTFGKKMSQAAKQAVDMVKKTFDAEEVHEDETELKKVLELLKTAPDVQTLTAIKNSYPQFVNKLAFRNTGSQRYQELIKAKEVKA